MGLGSSRRLALPATERQTAARKPRHPAASPPELLFDPGRLLVLQASAGNAAVAELIQRAPAAPPVTAHPATAAPTAPVETGPELLADVAQALTDRYTALTAATAHTTSAAADTGTATDAGAPGGAPRALGISKHVVVGGPAGVVTAWPKVEKQILKPAAGRAPMDVLALLYTSAGVHSLAALTKADRSELAAGLNSLLISWASDAHLTGTHADVDVLATDIADSFHASYVAAAAGKASAPKHVAIPAEAGVPPALWFKQHWPGIEKQIRKPVVAASSTDPLLHVLFTGTVAEQLLLVAPADREALKAKVFDNLVRYATDDTQTAETVENEWRQLTSRVQSNIENGRAGYVSVRGALLKEFGSFEDANAYYDQLVTAQFAGKTFGTLVHPIMQSRLAAATAKLAAIDPTMSAAAGITAYGFSIRENRNNVTQLSDHSFGFAIDIDAEMNPNIPGKVAKPLYPLVKAMTGTDVFVDTKGGKGAGNNFMLGLTAAQAQVEAERLRGASDAFKHAFKDEASVKKAMADYASGYATSHNFALPGVASGDDLFAKAKAAANNTASVPALTKSIFIEQGPLPAGAIGPKPADQQAVAGVLISIYVRWIESKSATKEAIAKSAGQIAHFGFLNLDPKLIAALSGSDGGGLQWLGAQTGGTKDFMHFQLAPEQQPAKRAVPLDAPAGEATA